MPIGDYTYFNRPCGMVAITIDLVVIILGLQDCEIILVIDFNLCLY
jgi:hypothetical protein